MKNRDVSITQQPPFLQELQKPTAAKKIACFFIYFFPLDSAQRQIAPHFVLPQSSKIFVIRSFFFEKWLLTHIFSGLKLKNPPASKLASDF